MIHFLQLIKDTLSKLLNVLDKKQKKYGILVFALSLLGAFLEVLGVGVILPLVEALLSTDSIIGNKWVQFVVQHLNLQVANSTDVVTIMLAVVIILFIVKNAYFIFLSWVRAKYSVKVSRELSSKMLRAYMNRGYEFFLVHNTADISRNINGDVSGVNTLIYQLFRILIDSITILFIVAYIFYTDWLIGLAIVLMALLSMAIIYGYFRKRIREAGKTYNKYNGINGKYLLQALHGIKEILVMHKQDFFVQNFESSNKVKQNASVEQTVGMESPAYIIEGLCVTGLLSVVSFRILMNTQDPISMIPALSAFTIGAFRILPSLGRISSAINTFIYYLPSLDHVYENLKEIAERDIENQTDNLYKIEKFTNKIELMNISWKYENSSQNIFSNLSLSIDKGTSVAFVGSSGAGKTTLADIILGLLIPQSGEYKIDGYLVNGDSVRTDLSKIIGYVPQTIYLTDDTIRNNVAFGIEASQIDDRKVWESLHQAKLAEYVKNLPDGLDTVVGDRGIRFSGGQRQRIAIARALYENPEIIIFDEATAALDQETESAVMESIQSLLGNKTIIIIAHRLTTIQNCDVIYEVEKGNIRKVSYENLILQKGRK